MEADNEVKDDIGTPSEFKKFDAVMRQIIRVPKAEVERRAAEAKKERNERRKSG